MSKAPSVDAAYAMGAKGGPAAEAERLAFEAWMRGHCWMLGGKWDGTSYRSTAETGQYICPLALQTRQLWAAWRDRAALTANVEFSGTPAALSPEAPLERLVGPGAKEGA